MNTLQQLEDVRNQLAQLDPNNRDHLVEIARLKNLESDLVKQVQAEEQRESEHIQRIEQAAEETAYALDEMVVAGLSMRQLCRTDDDYRLMKMAVQEYISSKVQALSGQILKVQEEADSRESTYVYQLNENNRKIAELEVENNRIGQELFQTKLEKEDSDKKREAAVQQAEEYKRQYELKDQELDNLRKEMAVGARNAWKVVDLESQRKEMEELAERIKNSKIKIVDLDWVDEIKKKEYKAKRADTLEPITFPYYDLNNYIVVQGEEADQERARFLANKEAPAVYQPLDATPPIPAIPEVTFPEMGHMAGPDASDHQEVARQDAVSREEFEALKADVEVLKRRQGMVA